MKDDSILKAVCSAVVLGTDENEQPVHLTPYEAAKAIKAYRDATGLTDRLFGNLLDRWEMTPNDLKQEMRDHGCGNQLDELYAILSAHHATMGGVK